MKSEDIENKVAQHEVLFEVFKERFDKMEDLLSNHIGDMTNKVHAIEKNLNKRPSWFISFALTAMASVIVGLATYLLTHG